jgi:hypothetical protein
MWRDTEAAHEHDDRDPKRLNWLGTEIRKLLQLLELLQRSCVEQLRKGLLQATVLPTRRVEQLARTAPQHRL